MGEILSAQGKEMSEIKSNIAALSTQMAAIMEEVKKNRIDRYRAQSRSPSRNHLILSIASYLFRSAIRGYIWDRRIDNTMA
jgi:hypothetical protein